MDSNEKWNLKDFSRQVISVALTVIIICFGYPIGFLILVSLITYRNAIQKLVRGLDPNFGDVLTGMNAAMSAHPPYTKPRSVLVPQYYLASSLDKNVFIKTFSENVVELKSPSGNLVYAQLRQKIVPKFGYNFWYKVDSFNIHDHIKFLDESSPNRLVKQDELVNLTSELSKCHFDERRSPWEIFIIPRLKLDKDPTVKSAVVMRFHHCLLDGFCLTNILEKLGNKPWNVVPLASGSNAEKVDLFNEKIIPTLRLLVKGPYEILKAFYFSGDNNSWIEKVTKASTGIVATQQTEILPLSAMRTICARSKGEFTNVSLLITIFLQATAKLMKKHGVVEGNPVKIHVSMPMPLPNHPAWDPNLTGLTNHFTFVKFPVVVDTNDVIRTARNVSKEYKRISESVLPQAFAKFADVLGSLPISWIANAGGDIICSCLLSNFPGPFHPVDICGVDVKEWVTGGSANSCALSSVATIYNGRLRYILFGDECIVKQDDVDFLAVSCQQILAELQSAAKLEKNGSIVN